MPELPEVEHARRSLERWAVGRAVAAAAVPPSRLLGAASPASLRRWLTGRRIESAARRGKHLLVGFEQATALHVHLGMSGCFAYTRDEAVSARWSRLPIGGPRLSLALDDGGTVALFDPRMFGRLDAGAWADLAARFFDPLGPDAWLEPLTGRHLTALLRGVGRPVKVALMDQSRVAGLGNIQVAEALWLARIHPERPGAALTRADASRLARAIRATLASTLADLEAGGGYLQDAGSENPFSVYGREGERCRRCRLAAIRRTVLAGRATYFCPRCQPVPR